MVEVVAIDVDVIVVMLLVRVLLSMQHALLCTVVMSYSLNGKYCYENKKSSYCCFDLTSLNIQIVNKKLQKQNNEVKKPVYKLLYSLI